MKKKRIGFLVLGYGLGGYEKRILNLIEYLSKNRISSVLLFTTRYLYDLINEKAIIDTKNVVMVPIRNSGKTKLSKILFVLRVNLILLANVFKFDLLHTSVTGISVVAFFSFLKRTLISVVDTREFFSLVDPVVAGMIKISLKNAYRIDCLNPIMVDYLNRNVKGIAKKIRVSPCSFVRHKEFGPDIIAQKGKKIAWMGRFVEGKGLELFLEALSTISDFLREKEYRVFIYGNGELKQKFQSYMDEHRLCDIVSMGFVLDTYSALKDCRLFVSTQSFSNYPSQVLIEAMSNYCLPVVTDVGDTYLLVTERNGILCDYSSPDIADGIIRAVNMPEPDKDKMMFESRNIALQHNIGRFTEYFISLAEI